MNKRITPETKDMNKRITPETKDMNKRITPETKDKIENIIYDTIRTGLKHGMLLCEDRKEIILGEIGITGAICPMGSKPILTVIIDRV